MLIYLLTDVRQSEMLRCKQMEVDERWVLMPLPPRHTTFCNDGSFPYRSKDNMIDVKTRDRGRYDGDADSGTDEADDSQDLIQILNVPWRYAGRHQ